MCTDTQRSLPKPLKEGGGCKITTCIDGSLTSSFFKGLKRLLQHPHTSPPFRGAWEGFYNLQKLGSIRSQTLVFGFFLEK